MALDFSADLIRDIQVRLRRAAGVPSYDPGDSALPSVPAIDETVAALDPSAPDYLCCRRCHGRLPRGINSTLCIFCGEEQRREGSTMSMCFNSTAAYRNLLQSLGLDGSEIVNLETESMDSAKGFHSPKGSMTLSTLLNLELNWPIQVEQNHNSSSCNAPSHVASISLSGINLDSFFSDKKDEISGSLPTQEPQLNSHAHDSSLSSVDMNTLFSSTTNETASSAQKAKAEQYIPQKQVIDTQVFLPSGSQNPVFFESHQTLEEVKNSDQVDEWETDFQAANSATTGGMSKVIDPFPNPVVTMESTTIDLFPSSATSHSNPETITKDLGNVVLFHDSTEVFSYPQITSTRDETLNSVHGFNMNGRLANEGSQLASSDVLFEGNIWPEINAKTSREANQVESISNTKDEEEACASISLTQDDDLFDDWQDFTTSTDPSGGPSSSQAQTNGQDIFSGYSSGATPGALDDMEFGSFKQSDPYLRALGDLQSSSDVKTINGDASVEVRWDQSNDETGSSPIAQRAFDIPVSLRQDSSNSKVDLLLARMPDLSFMLEEMLSLPNKSLPETNA